MPFVEHYNLEELQRLLIQSKRIFEDAFADGMPYEEVNLRYLEFRALRDEVNKRMQETENSERNQ